MPPIITTNEQNVLVEASKFPCAKFPFDKFNPVQSRVFEYYDKDNNLLIASSTSSGKTVIAEMVLAHDIQVNKKKGLYLVPLKALAQEKIDDWTTPPHHFSNLKISICTGDYRLTPERRAELDAADLIIMSYEMFNSRVRNIDSERSEFLKKCGTLVADEVHLLTVPRRGDHLEAGLMKFTEINKDCKLVFLSATMPNVAEIANWTSFVLNNKPTVLIESKYRPCPLNLHYEKYYDSGSYDDKERAKVNLALEIVEYYPEDKFLIFVHTKRTGELMKKELRDAGIECEFHNADLTKDSRVKLEKRFKEDKGLMVVIATSTLAWGVNLPARRVIITGVHRGLDEVASYDIHQMIGRAGRPAFDPVGDAYILLPESMYDLHKERIRKPQLILSQMLEQVNKHYKTLAFHIVSEIHQGLIKTKEDVHHWYNRSLGCFQANELHEFIVDETLDLLRKYGAIWEEDGVITVTSVGKIASLFYYSPFDVSDLKRNFNKLFDDNRETSDLSVAVSLGNIDTHKNMIVTRDERAEMSAFAGEVARIYGNGTIIEPAIKMAYVYYQLLNGIDNPIFVSAMRNVQWDFPRLSQVLQALDGFGGRWDKGAFLAELQTRVSYGVNSSLVELCKLPEIGKVRANKLYNAGIKNANDIVNNPDIVRKVLKWKAAQVEELLTEAKKLVLTSH